MRSKALRRDSSVVLNEIPPTKTFFASADEDEDARVSGRQRREAQRDCFGEADRRAAADRDEAVSATGRAWSRRCITSTHVHGVATVRQVPRGHGAGGGQGCGATNLQTSEA